MDYSSPHTRYTLQSASPFEAQPWSLPPPALQRLSQNSVSAHPAHPLSPTRRHRVNGQRAAPRMSVRVNLHHLLRRRRGATLPLPTPLTCGAKWTALRQRAVCESQPRDLQTRFIPRSDSATTEGSIALSSRPRSSFPQPALVRSLRLAFSPCWCQQGGGALVG